MKKTFTALLLLFVMLPALTEAAPVPDDVSLRTLPAGTRLVAAQAIPLEGGERAVLSGKESAFFASRSIGTIAAGTAFPVRSGSLSSGEDASGIFIYWATADGNSGLMGFYDRDGPRPRTVGDFRKLVGRFLLLEYDDPFPYAGMDKSIVVDIVMKKIVEGLQSNKPAETLPQFAYLEKLGVPLPESFEFYYTDTLAKAGKKDAAREHANAYLKTYGKKGKYYPKVIEIMGRL